MPRDPHIPLSDRSAAPADRLERLRTRIGAIERAGRGAWGMLPLGMAEIDRRLGGGLALGALHEIVAVDAGAACAFAAVVAARAARRRDGAVLWCASPHTLEAGALYGPGLRALGLDSARLIAVAAARDDAVLWAMEEGLRCTRLAAVIGETGDLSLTASRRLQLAAGESGVTALVLRPRSDSPPPSAATTRWRLSAAGELGDEFGGEFGGPEDGTGQPPGEISDARTTRTTRRARPAPPGLGAARWRVELFRCRGGTTANWMMEWSDETGDFSVAAMVRDRPPLPAAAGLAG